MATQVSPYDTEYDTTESRWFKMVVLIMAVIILIMSVINVVYYNKVRQGQTLSSSEASVLLWLNVIIIVIVVIVIFWSLWRIMFSREYRDQAGSSARRYFQGYGNGIVQRQAPMMAPMVASNGVVMVGTSGAASQDVLSINAANQIAGAQG